MIDLKRAMKDEIFLKWLRIGFKFLTGIREEDPDSIIAYLKAIRNMSDNEIYSMVTQPYYGPIDPALV